VVEEIVQFLTRKIQNFWNSLKCQGFISFSLIILRFCPVFAPTCKQLLGFLNSHRGKFAATAARAGKCGGIGGGE